MPNLVCEYGLLLKNSVHDSPTPCCKHFMLKDCEVGKQPFAKTLVQYHKTIFEKKIDTTN